MNTFEMDDHGVTWYVIDGKRSTGLKSEEVKRLDFFNPEWREMPREEVVELLKPKPIPKPPAVWVPAEEKVIDGAKLLDEVEDLVRKYCVLPDEPSYVAVTLWIAHTHCFRAWDTSPRLAILSAEMNSGKTRILEVINLLSYDATLLMSATMSYVFRRYEQGQPTLLVDETDALFSTGRGGQMDPGKQELRGIINAGYRKGAMVGRVETIGSKLVPTDYPVFGAVALAGIGRLPDTLMSRSVVVWVKRRTADERIEPFRERRAGRQATPIRSDLMIWGPRQTQALGTMLNDDELVIPEEITDRNADVWEPLLAVAEVAGGDWPDRARKAALAFVTSHQEANEDTVGVVLLRDIRRVFGDAVTMPSETLCAWLQADTESMWDERLSPAKLARYLKPYQIVTRQIRFDDGTNRRGYERAAFVDAWSRYAGERS